ncbi:acyltransferase [Deefgea piscis]|uniref:acyltransferase n=1 Tax=Deefgea piscis TaxID=2739061 RepID=UPI001C7E9863|nr:acyltransferase family protein [Deefgea piscis]QZA81907.1 acyltransferase family protein [Deefgea piscis]
MVWLDNSRIIAIFAVVLLHISARVVIQSDIGTTHWWIGNFYDSLVRWCVPVFVMISGALLLDPSKKEDLKTFYLKRLSRILIPLIFWSAFFLLFANWQNPIQGEPLPILEWAQIILSGRPYYHMWFLYMIIILYLFTPFFRKIVANSSKNEISILILLTLTLSALNSFLLPESNIFINWFLSYIPYFFLGYLIKEDQSNYPSPILWGVFLASVILTAAGCYVVATKEGLEAGLYFYHYLSVTVIPMSISAFYLLKKLTKPIGSMAFTKKIAALTLGVYLIHPIVINIINSAGYGPLNFHPLVSIPAITVVVFSLSLITAWLINTVPHLKRVI